MFAEKTKI